MTPAEATAIIASLEDYYKKTIAQNPIAVTVWLELFLPMSPDEGAAIAKLAIEEFEWLPSPKKLREEFAQRNGLNFKQELQTAIAVFCSHDRRKIQTVPREICAAVREAGGVQKFTHASEKDYPALEKKYISIRTKAQTAQRLTVLAGGKQQQFIGGSHEGR